MQPVGKRAYDGHYDGPPAPDKLSCEGCGGGPCGPGEPRKNERQMKDRELFNKAGKAAVSSIRAEFLDKGLVATGRSMDSVHYVVSTDGITVFWPPHSWALINGRPPGKRPPFDAIRAWVAQKLDPPEEDVWFITDRICQKIAQHGTRIYRKEAKGLEVDIVFAAATKLIREGSVRGYRSLVHNKISKIWDLK